MTSYLVTEAGDGLDTEADDDLILEGSDISTGSAFSLQVEVAQGQEPLASTSLTWTDITTYVKRASISRGRSHFLEQFAPGTASVTCDNTTSFFDTLPYQVAPRMPVRISVNDSTGLKQILFTGFVKPSLQSLRFSYVPPTWSEVTFDCEDYLAVAARQELPEQDPPVGRTRSGDSIVDIAFTFQPLFPFWQAAKISNGVTVMQDIPLGTDALSVFQMYAQSEGGAFYVDREGNVTFDDRMSFVVETRQWTSQATFSSGAAAYAVEGFELSFPPVYTSASVQRLNADDEQTYTATTPAADYGTASYPAIRGAYMTSSAAAQALARRIVGQSLDTNPTAVTLRVFPRRGTDEMDAAAKRELCDCVTFDGSDYTVEHIAHQFDMERLSWACDLTLRSRAGRLGDWTTDDWFVLDFAGFGDLDGSRQLAW